MPGLCLHDLMLLPVERALAFFRDLQLPAPLDKATDLLLDELRSRTGFLSAVGLAYLTLDRQSRTLSGGEVQRINLTTALGTSLVNTLFVLDEPSIGLHPRDMQRVIAVMKRLRDAGNSLLVVEHDPQIMLEADRIIDMGPGAGERGGQIVFNGTPVKLRQSKTSLTAEYLSGRRTLPVSSETPRRSAPDAPGEVVAEARTNRWLEIRGIRHHNIKGIDVRIPLKRMVCITGVSGSGKSTVVEDVLYPALLKYKGRPSEAPGEFESLRGAELIDDVVMVDQTPIGRTTRSNPASYVGAFRCDPRTVLAGAHGCGAQVHGRHLQFQLRQWPLPDLQRQRLRTRGDAVSLRRVSALPGLQWHPLPRRSAGSQTRRQRRPARQHRRGAEHDGHRGPGLLR